MFEKLNFPVLLVSFCIGICIVYVTAPPPEVVLKFPSPYNTGDVIYTDKSNNCYKYKHDKVQCDANHGVQPQPVTENFG